MEPAPPNEPVTIRASYINRFQKPRYVARHVPVDPRNSPSVGAGRHEAGARGAGSATNATNECVG